MIFEIVLKIRLLRVFNDTARKKARENYFSSKKSEKFENLLNCFGWERWQIT